MRNGTSKIYAGISLIIGGAVLDIITVMRYYLALSYETGFEAGMHKSGIFLPMPLRLVPPINYYILVLGGLVSALGIVSLVSGVLANRRPQRLSSSV